MIKSSAVLHNGLAPHWRQAIIQNNDWLNAKNKHIMHKQLHMINSVTLDSRSHGLCIGRLKFRYWWLIKWRHNGWDGVSNHQPHDCILNCFFQAQIKENIIAPRHWSRVGNLPVTGEFPAQKASNADDVSIWWRHHEPLLYTMVWRRMGHKPLSKNNDWFSTRRLLVSLWKDSW